MLYYRDDICNNANMRLAKLKDLLVRKERQRERDTHTNTQRERERERERDYN